jgi:hypothetical protein
MFHNHVLHPKAEKLAVVHTCAKFNLATALVCSNPWPSVRVSLYWGRVLHRQHS